MDNPREALRQVAKTISKKISSGTIIGLGSGSTVAVLIEELSPLVIAKSKQVSGVPTSMQIEMVASKNGIAIASFKGSVDLLIDGADQVDQNLNLVKGGGGALLREKVVMSGAKEVVIVASEHKF